MKNKMEYRIATEEDLEKIWKKDVENHPSDERWVRWREEYISYNKNGSATTFVALLGDEPVGQITLLFSPNCSAINGKLQLANGKNIANMNAFRIEKKFEGQGHISKLVKLAEKYAKESGISTLTIGVDADETRNLAIYLHFGYDKFVMSEIEDDKLVLYYSKNIKE